MQPRANTSPRRPAARELFRHDDADGSIRQNGGQRIVAIAEPLLRSLHYSLSKTLDDGTPSVLYRTGYEWALQEMLSLNQAMREEFGSTSFDFWQMDLKFLLETWWLSHESAGWGSLQMDLSALARGLAFLELRGSAVAAALTGASEPVCHLYAGLFAGALSFCQRAERHAVEVQCSAMGKGTCRFVLGPGAEIDSAESWRKQGILPAEIIRRLS